MRLLNLLCALLLTLGACFSASAKKAKATINTRCEYLASPLGIDTPAPRFTWSITNVDNGFSQASYSIEVATNAKALQKGENLVWQSGLVESGNTLATYAGKPLQSCTQYCWRVTITNTDGDKFVSPIGVFETAIIDPSLWEAKWISDGRDKEVEAAPMLRKAFSIDKKIARARLYVSATGYYEMFINGKRVGENFLDPGFTAYDRRNLYVTHDVTKLLSRGNNAISAVLGNGFANCQSRAVWNFEKASWRKRPALLCQMLVTYTDGTTQTFITDNSWSTTTGPYTYNNIYSGDRYDASLEIDGWKSAKFNDSNWQKAVVTPAPSPILQAQTMPAIQINDELKPVLLKNIDNRIFVFDMGKNIAGLCRLTVKNADGVKFTLRHGELLKTDGTLEPGNIDVYYRPEKPGEVFQCDEFTARGNAQTSFTPQFSYHGFRYVQVECSEPYELSAENLTGLHIHTNLTPVGSFHCSNELLNKIYRATCLSYVNNAHSIPTDCPQREKNGWTADAWVSTDLGLLNYDGIKFYEKWMTDFIDNQRENGDIAGIVPTYDWGYGEWPGPVWDAALTIIPDLIYRYYGDSRCIEALYPTMLRHMECLRNWEKEGGFLDFGLGDWVFWKDQTSNEFTSTLYYYNNCLLMAKFADLLGNDKSWFVEKAAILKNNINSKFFNAETNSYAEGTQTAQAMALYMGIVPPEKELAVAERLHKIVKDNNYFLNFGLLGSKSVPAMLTKYGYVDAAYKMITKTEAPSWGYWVETMGHTTLAETWTLSPQFNDASLDHVFMGDVIAWMQNTLAGINGVEPGFKHIKIAPHFIPDLQFVEGHYNSVLGPVMSEWHRNGEQIILTVTIPVGATATIEAGEINTQVGSGTHTFTINKPL